MVDFVTINGKKYLTGKAFWIETVSAEDSQLEQVGTVTTASGDKLLKVRTKLAFVDKKNNNNRVYKTEIIKPQVDKLQSRIERRKSVGEVDHPDDNVSRVRNIGVKWDKVWLDASDGWIKGEGTIPNTSMGKELRACYEANIAIGWSMRGRGTLLPGDWQGEQALIMQGDYLLETFDAVVGESNEGADVEKFWIEQTSTSDRCEGLLVCPCAVEKISGQEGKEVLTEAEKSQREKDKEAQEARSKKHGIEIKDGGSVTKPGEYSNIPDSEFADPVNYAYPIDATHIVSASQYWGKPANKAKYTSAEQKIITDRIDKARKKHKIGEYAQERTVNISERLKVDKLGDVKITGRITDDETWNWFKENYITAILWRGTVIEECVRRDIDAGTRESTIYEFKIDNIIVSTEPLQEEINGEIKILDETAQTFEASLFNESYYGMDDSTEVEPDALKPAMENYMSNPPKGVLYLNGRTDRPVGRIEKWQGAESNNQTTERMKGGVNSMEIKDLKIDDLRKDRKDLIDALSAEIKESVLKEIKEKASDPKYLESIGVKVTPPVVAPPDVKTDPAIESLKKVVDDLKAKSESSEKIIGEMKAQIEAGNKKDEAVKALETELKSKDYEKTSPIILQIVKKNLAGLVSDPKNVKEQVAVAIGLATTLEKQTTGGKGFTVIPGSDPEQDGTPAPITEKKVNPISGLTIEQEKVAQDKLGIKPKPVTETKPA